MDSVSASCFRLFSQYYICCSVSDECQPLSNAFALKGLTLTDSREAETWIKRDTQRYRARERHRERETGRERCRYTQTHRWRDTDRQTYRQRKTYVERERDRVVDKVEIRIHHWRMVQTIQ